MTKERGIKCGIDRCKMTSRDQMQKYEDLDGYCVIQPREIDADCGLGTRAEGNQSKDIRWMKRAMGSDLERMTQEAEGGERASKTQTQRVRLFKEREGREMKERPNAICNETIDASTQYSIRWWRLSMEGKGREEEGFAKAKAESVRCLLNITKYGLYPTQRHLAPPWGIYPSLPFFPCCFGDSSVLVRNIVFFVYSHLSHFRSLQSLSSTRPFSVTLGTDLGVATRISKLHILLHIPLHAIGSIDNCQIIIRTTRDDRCQIL